MGNNFVNLLKLIAIPLVFVSIVKGVSSLKDISKLSRIGSKTIGLYLLSTAFSVTIGLVLVNLISPGNSIPDEKSSELKQTYRTSADIKIKTQIKLKIAAITVFVDIVPSNIIVLHLKIKTCFKSYFLPYFWNFSGFN